MAVARKSKKGDASRKSRQGKLRKILTRRGKVAAKSKRNFYIIKFPRSSYLTACPLLRWYFSQKLRDHHLSIQKGKHPIGLGPIHRKTSMRVDNQKKSMRVDNQKKSMRVDNRKKSMRVNNRKKSVRVDNRKKSVRVGKQKKTHNAKCTCPNVMQAALRQVARKKRAKWVVTGAKKRKRYSNKESFYKMVKPAVREEGEGNSSSLDSGAQDLGAHAPGMIPLPTASELQEVSS